MTAANTSTKQFDVVVVGAGFSGLFMLHRLRGLGFSVRVVDMASDVGGTWYWNRYPGARCDVESMQYCFEFSPELEQEWNWSERYTAQPEILRYAHHVVERFDLRRDIHFNTRVESAVFDESSSRWLIATNDGGQLNASYCVMATGCLSAPNTPHIKGLDSFEGALYHTGQWPHEPVDFSGLRVGVIGTGSSAIQSIPVIAAQARELYVFQRTAHWSVPAHNRALEEEERSKIKARYPEIRARAKQSFSASDLPVNKAPAAQASGEEHQQRFSEGWAFGGFAYMTSFDDLLFDADSNQVAADFARAKIREVVKDSATAELLCPKIIIGAKRLCLDTNYYQTFNLPHVKLVDINGTPIEEILPNGLRARGTDYELDVIVLATGFDAMTGALINIDIRGSNGASLREKWKAGTPNFLGITMAGFPNLFAINGPGSPSVFTNMMPAIEHHVEWITECLSYLREHGLSHIEATPEAEEQWGKHSDEVAVGNLRTTIDTWYVGANIPGKARSLMPYIGGFPLYAEKCKEVAESGYSAFSTR